EVRTDKKGTLRAAEGILVTTEPQTRAQGKQLDMSATIRQLEQALTLAKTLQQSASIAQATPVAATKQQQLQQALNGLSHQGCCTMPMRG
ncbi:type VI secretion system Vgr family protein, partial [Obesumbacterium proteus]|uniref:type VI secretion system Vgr family protein n=1 Tax=Obesumbacterium proteus TaxID=82983 RepID=UPI00242F1EB3